MNYIASQTMAACGHYVRTTATFKTEVDTLLYKNWLQGQPCPACLYNRRDEPLPETVELEKHVARLQAINLVLLRATKNAFHYLSNNVSGFVLPKLTKRDALLATEAALHAWYDEFDEDELHRKPIREIMREWRGKRG